MKRYVLATQHDWGRLVFDIVAHPGESWVMRHVDDPASSNGPTLEDVCVQVDPRYVFLVHWSQYVPAAVFERWETVNLHCTPLPYGRGGHPIENMLLAGHKKTCMTAHRVVAELDAGPIYGLWSAIDLDLSTKAAILESFVTPCAGLIRMVVDQEPTPTAQVGQVVKFSRLSKEAYARFWAARGAVDGGRQ